MLYKRKILNYWNTYAIIFELHLIYIYVYIIIQFFIICIQMWQKIPTVLKYTTQLNVKDEVRIRRNLNNAIQDYHAISLWFHYPEVCMYIWIVNFLIFWNCSIVSLFSFSFSNFSNVLLLYLYKVLVYFMNIIIHTYVCTHIYIHIYIHISHK